MAKTWSARDRTFDFREMIRTVKRCAPPRRAKAFEEACRILIKTAQYWCPRDAKGRFKAKGKK